MAKFKVGDWVRCSCPYLGWPGTTAEVTRENDPYYEIQNHLGVREFHESWLTTTPMPPAAVPLPAEALLAGFGQSVPPQPWVDGLAGGQCKSVTPKIEPVCPSCGCKDARNYVGFSSIECANSRCAHYKELVNG